MKYLKFLVLFVTGVLLLCSCEEKLQSEYGVSKIFFSTASAGIQYRGIDSIALQSIKNEADTTYMIVGVYRSAIVDNLEEITVKLAIDSAYTDSLINKAQTASSFDLTDLMKKYKNSKALGASFFSVPASVTIPKGDRRAIVPVTIKRSLVKLYNNAKFNYNTSDLANANMPKDKMLLLPIKITETSDLPVLESQKRHFLQITKLGNLK